MDPFDSSSSFGPLSSPLPSPAKVKVFAPNGETKEAVCWIGIRSHAQHPDLTELFLQYENGATEVLNKKVVVQNLETGEVIYNPRLVPRIVAHRVYITGSEANWLQRHPHWPGILELYDNPADKETDDEGLSPWSKKPG